MLVVEYGIIFSYQQIYRTWPLLCSGPVVLPSGKRRGFFYRPEP